MRLTTATAAVTASMLLAACGGGSDGGATGGGDRESREQKAEDAMLKFAQCMREQGVEVGDPDEKGLIRVGPGAGGDGGAPKNPEKFRRAEEQCGKHMREAGPPPEFSKEEQADFERKGLAFARCMREQGIDVPDPETSGDGTVMQELPDGIDPQDERFRKAEEKCRSVGPGLPGAVEEAP